MKMTTKNYDVVIVGAGVTGTALLYSLAKYTNINKIAIIEKYDKIAQVQSGKDNNSQTLHFGDIETNYSLEKATKVKAGADLVKAYVEKNPRKGLFNKTNKMVLAVGEEEVKTLEKRHKEFKKLFPELKKLNREEIAKYEPKVVEARNEKIPLLALMSNQGYAVNYAELAQSFVDQAKNTNKVNLFLNCKVKGIAKVNDKQDDYYCITTDKEKITAKVVVVTASGQSLGLAQQLGYGKNLILLPVAGSFYRAPKLLNGKVYMMQLKKLPFAAIHGDPDVLNPDETRFGPTAKVLPMLERYKYKTVFDFFNLFEFRFDAVLSIIKILSDWTVLKYILRNVLYDVPLIGKLFFIKEVRKIIPSIKLSQLDYGSKIGGIRPQVVNTKTKTMSLGEAKILGENIIFNITPSPGASVCLKNAEVDTLRVMEFFGKKFKFNHNKFLKDHSV